MPLISQGILYDTIHSDNDISYYFNFVLSKELIEIVIHSDHNFNYFVKESLITTSTVALSPLKLK